MVAASRLRRAQERIQHGAAVRDRDAARACNSLATRVDPTAHPLLDERHDAARRRQGAAVRDHRRSRPVRQLQHQRDQGGQHLHRREPGARSGARAWSAAAAATISRAAASRSATSRSTCSRRCSIATRRASPTRRSRRSRPGRSTASTSSTTSSARSCRSASSSSGCCRFRALEIEPAERPARRRRSTIFTSRRRRSCSTRCIPRHVEVQVFRALLESNAAFYAAQMTAMDCGVAQRGGHDRAADALHEQGPPGGDHPRDHRSRFGRRGFVVRRVNSQLRNSQLPRRTSRETP